MAVKIKHVKGNVLRLHIPLTVKIKRLVNEEITEEEQDFIPSPYYPTFINLKKDVGLTQSFKATVDGNVVSMEDKGTLSVGEYQVEVKCNDDLGYPYRYMVKAVVEIVDATIDAGIEAGIEFDSEDYTLDGAVFISYGGGVFEQIQSDWEETLEDARSFIRNKPDLSVYQEKEEGKVLSSNDYTDAEKTKLANLNNYDDTNLRNLISQKVDKVIGKGLSTNDYTSQEKTKLANLDNYDDSQLRIMINAKVDKVSGKGLSTNDYTTQEKVKLSQLSNYDDSQIRSMINNLATSLANNYYTKSLTYNKNEVNSLIEAVQSFSLVYVGELPTPSANTLRKMYLVPSSSSSRQNIKDEYITIQSSGQYRWELIGSTDIDLSNYVTITQFNTALASLSTVARTGSYNDLINLPSFKTINNQSIIGTGNIDIEGGDGAQADWNETNTTDPSYIKNKPTLADVATSGSYDDLEDKPSIPAEVTESTVAGWGFTKNTGTYSKPSGGIPSTDMSSDVQTSLGKADTALQSYTETDPTVPSWAKASSKPSYTASEVGALPDDTVIPTITFIQW